MAKLAFVLFKSGCPEIVNSLMPGCYRVDQLYGSALREHPLLVAPFAPQRERYPQEEGQKRKEQLNNINHVLDIVIRGWLWKMWLDIGLKRSFLSKHPTLPKINDLAKTKTPGKTFAVLAGFCHSEA